MVAEIPFVLLVGGAGILGLYLANVFYDYGVPQYISRKVGHLGGAVAFLLSPLLFSSFWWPLILTAGFTGLLLYARMSRPALFRGVGGSGRPDALAEIHFPATGIVLIGVVWGILDMPWVAIVPLVFMGAGDAETAREGFGCSSPITTASSPVMTELPPHQPTGFAEEGGLPRGAKIGRYSIQ